jgi:hypothetical protein
MITMEYQNPEETMLADGYEEAIIGIDTSKPLYRVVYSVDKMIDIMSDKENISKERAKERLVRDILTVDLGAGTPVYMQEATYEQVIVTLEPKLLETPVEEPAAVNDQITDAVTQESVPMGKPIETDDALADINQI